MSYNENIRRVLQAMGVDPYKHLPVDGIDGKIVPLQSWFRTTLESGLKDLNVSVWIVPLVRRARPDGRFWKSSKHRVLCECPRCGHQLSAGRLLQHIGTLKCLRMMTGDLPR